MELSVAIVVFLIKAGIKQLDKQYDIQSFLEDVVGAFGEKTGEKIASLITSSKEGIDHALCDSNLLKLGIPSSRTAQTREKVKDILKYTKISNAMLIDYNCDAREISEYLIKKYADKIEISSDESAICDVKKALFQIIQDNIRLAKKDNDFINSILFDIKKIVEKNTATLQEIKVDVHKGYINSEDILKVTNENNRLLKEFLDSQKTHKNDMDNWCPFEGPPILEKVDKNILEALVGIQNREVE